MSLSLWRSAPTPPERRRSSENSCKYGLWSISKQLERNATECRYVPSIFLLFKKKLDGRGKISFHRVRLSRSAITRSVFDYPTVLTSIYTTLLSTLIRIILWSQLSDTFKWHTTWQDTIFLQKLMFNKWQTSTTHMRVQSPSQLCICLKRLKHPTRSHRFYLQLPSNHGNKHWYPQGSNWT